MHCTFIIITWVSSSLQVEPKHVKEAFRLLNKSIIRVETPDIQFNEEEEQGELNSDPHVNFDNPRLSYIKNKIASWSWKKAYYYEGCQ